MSTPIYAQGWSKFTEVARVGEEKGRLIERRFILKS